MPLRFHSDNAGSKHIEQIVSEVSDGSDTEDLMIDNFLDAVSARLNGIPAQRRDDLCRELRQHLEASIAAREELGDDREAATAAAVQQIGDASAIAQRFQRAWKSTAAYQSPFAAMRIGLVGFSMAAAALPLVINPLLSPLQNKSGVFFTNPVAQWAFFIALFWLPSICAGAWVAKRASSRAVLGSFLALSALACLFLPLSFLDLSPSDGWVAGLFGAKFMNTVILPVFQLGGITFVLWLPIGSLSAGIAAFSRDSRNRVVQRRASA